MLINVSTLKTYLGITWSDQDSLLDLIAKNASGVVDGYIGRVFESNDYVEIVDGVAQTSIVLSQYPVTAVASIEVNDWDLGTPSWTAIDPKEYSVSLSDGIVRFTSYMNRGFSEYKVTYTAGHTDIPWDIQAACLEIASWMYNNRSTAGIKSEQVAGDKIEYTGGIPQGSFSALDKYRDVNF